MTRVPGGKDGAFVPWRMRETGGRNSDEVGGKVRNSPSGAAEGRGPWTSPLRRGRPSHPGEGPSMVTACPVLKPRGSSGLKPEANIWPRPQGHPLKTQLPKLLILFKVFQKLVEVSKLLFWLICTSTMNHFLPCDM